jgi:hypothetical protein
MIFHEPGCRLGIMLDHGLENIPVLGSRSMAHGGIAPTLVQPVKEKNVGIRMP